MVSLWFVVGCVVAVVLTLAGLTAAVFGWCIRHHDDDWGFIFWPSLIILVCTIAATAWGMYPYDMQYHRYRHVTGTVDKVEARMLADGDATTQQYAVRYRETSETYRCDDSRCSLLKPGDHLELWCIREWQYASTSGWGCRFDRTTPTAGA